jgi:hypothetical protein
LVSIYAKLFLKEPRMNWKHRPSLHELQRKLTQARKALSSGKYYFGPNLDKLVEDFMGLNIGNAEDMWPLLRELLEEIQPENYAGPHPPMKSIFTGFNCELFVFVWDSKKLKKNMYLKFAIKDEYFYYVSLHKSQKPEKCWKMVDNFQRSTRSR